MSYKQNILMEQFVILDLLESMTRNIGELDSISVIKKPVNDTVDLIMNILYKKYEIFVYEIVTENSIKLYRFRIVDHKNKRIRTVTCNNMVKGSIDFFNRKNRNFR